LCGVNHVFGVTKGELVFGIACSAFRMASPHAFLTSLTWKSDGRRRVHNLLALPVMVCVDASKCSQ